MRLAAMKPLEVQSAPLGDTPFVQFWQREIFATHAVYGGWQPQGFEAPPQRLEDLPALFP